MQVTDELIEYLDKESKVGTEFNAKDLYADVALDVIASVGFGVEAHALKNPEGDFR